MVARAPRSSSPPGTSIGVPPVWAIPVPEATEPVPLLESPVPGAVAGAVAVPGGAAAVPAPAAGPAGDAAPVVAGAAGELVGDGTLAVVTGPVADGGATRVDAPSPPRSRCFATAAATPPTISTEMAATRTFRAVVDRVLRAEVPSVAVRSGQARGGGAAREPVHPRLDVAGAASARVVVHVTGLEGRQPAQGETCSGRPAKTTRAGASEDERERATGIEPA